MLRKERYIACIIAGGGGTRFWPLSTPTRPKQYLKLLSDKSLLVETYKRYKSIFGRDNLFIITIEAQKKLVMEEIPDLARDKLIIEPELRDTCPAISYFTMLAQSLRGPDAVAGIFPSDHHISDSKSFKTILGNAYKNAENSDKIITIGIKPDYPSTQYGYIETESRITNGTAKAKKFHEKPDRKTAENLIKTKTVFWNSGMFVWKCSTFMNELNQHSPEHHAAITCIFHHFGHKDFENIVRERYSQLPKTSVDYAVMEKSKNILVLEGKFKWSDIGSWKALYQFVKKDRNSNHVRGKVKLSNSSGNFIINETENLLVINDIHNSVVVKTTEGTLFSSMDGTDSIKKIVNKIL